MVLRPCRYTTIIVLGLQNATSPANIISQGASILAFHYDSKQERASLVKVRYIFNAPYLSLTLFRVCEHTLQVLRSSLHLSCRRLISKIAFVDFLVMIPNCSSFMRTMLLIQLSCCDT